MCPTSPFRGQLRGAAVDVVIITSDMSKSCRSDEYCSFVPSQLALSLRHSETVSKVRTANFPDEVWVTADDELVTGP